MHARRFAAAALLLAFAAAAGGGCGRSGDDVGSRAREGVERAAAFLVAQQSADGAWRSATYGALADGPSLTPPVLKALAFAVEFGAVERERGGSAAACDRAAAWLAGLAAGGADAIPPLEFPVYTAALAATVLARRPEQDLRDASRAWLELLRRHQLDERLGWRESDLAYGGFGYSVVPPRRPRDGVLAPFDADLSSTLFALGALSLAGAAPDDPAIARARAFVERCQNFAPDDMPDDAHDADAAFDDGGFFLSPTHDAQNKAGIAGVDRRGRTRFHSYGSATADGVRALLRCGLAADHPRVVAARRWLERNFTTASHPGTFTRALEHDRDACFFYWCWSAAHAFQRLGITHLDAPNGPIDPFAALAEAVLARQSPDGSFANPLSFVKEDDPLIATSLAMAVLGIASGAR